MTNSDPRLSAGTVEAILRRALDDIEVEDGKCRWADVANILPYVRGELRSAAQRAPEAVAWRVKNDFGHWYVTQHKDLADTWRDFEGYEVQDLYVAQPPAAPVETELADLRCLVATYANEAAEAKAELAALKGSSAASERAEVSIVPMALTDGRTDYFVQIKVGDRAVTPHVFREEYKSAYHVALYDWLLNGAGEEPDCVEFGPDDWPGRVMPAVPQALSKPIAWRRVRDDGVATYWESAAPDGQPLYAVTPPEASVQAERDRCVALCEGWMERFEGMEIQYTSPREYACDAINDIMDLIRDGRDPSSQRSQTVRETDAYRDTVKKIATVREKRLADLIEENAQLRADLAKKRPETLTGMIAEVYGKLDAEDCAMIDREWARMRGYILPSNGTSMLTRPASQGIGK